MALLRLGWNSHNKPRKKTKKKNKFLPHPLSRRLCWPPDVQFSNPINRRTSAPFPPRFISVSNSPWTASELFPPNKKERNFTLRMLDLTEKNVILPHIHILGNYLSDFVNRWWFRSEWRMNNTYQVGCAKNIYARCPFLDTNDRIRFKPSFFFWGGQPGKKIKIKPVF